VLAFFVLAALSASQTSIHQQTPNARNPVEGSKSVLGYLMGRDARVILNEDAPEQVLVRLPSVHRKAAPRLLGMLHDEAEVEVFLGWTDPESAPGDVRQHIEIFRGKRGSELALIRDFRLPGGPGTNVRFFRPPDRRDSEAVLVDVQGGAYWGTTYVLSPDRKSIARLFDASEYEFADVDLDGVYELIAWNRRPFDVRCNFGIFGVRFYPEVFIRAGHSYRKAGPPPTWAAPDGQLETRFRKRERAGVPWGAHFQIVATPADPDGDGVGEVVVLQDRFRDEPAQTLAVYRLENGSFRLIARRSLSQQRIAYLIGGIRGPAKKKEILV
jgi:hypothetical protein